MKIQEVFDVIEESARVGAEEVRQIFSAVVVCSMRFAGVQRLRSEDTSVEIREVDFEVGLEKIRERALNDGDWGSDLGYHALVSEKSVVCFNLFIFFSFLSLFSLLLDGEKAKVNLDQGI